MKPVIAACALLIIGLAAREAPAQPVYPDSNLGWPGGDAAMECADHEGFIPAFRKRGGDWRFSFIIDDGAVGALRRGRHLSLVLGQSTLTPRGFSVVMDVQRSLPAADPILYGFDRAKRIRFDADFAAGRVEVSEISGFPSVEPARAPGALLCTVLQAPIFPAPAPASGVTAEMWQRLERLAAAPEPLAPAPADAAEPSPASFWIDALTARSQDEVREAVEAAISFSRDGGTGAIGDLAWFSASGPGRSHGLSPSGRAIVLGRPAERCPIVAEARQTLVYGALAAAYEECVARLPQGSGVVEGASCGCAAAAAEDVLLGGAEDFEMAPGGALLVVSDAEGRAVENVRGAFAPDLLDPGAARIVDAGGREICDGLQVGRDGEHEMECVRFGASYIVESRASGRRGMELTGVAAGADPRRAPDDPRRMLLAFYGLDEEDMARIEAALPTLWNE